MVLCLRPFVRHLSLTCTNKSLLLNSCHVTCVNRTYAGTPENPFSRVSRILKDDLISVKDSWVTGKKREKKNNLPTHCDVLIVGGGVMGASIAYWLKERALDALEVVIVEKDPTVTEFSSLDKLEFRQCTSALSVGGIRQQFSLKENIELSLFSAEFMRNIKDYLSIEGMDPPDIQFNPCGYVFLATESSAQILTDNVNLQMSLGAKVELLSPQKLKDKFPWMNTSGIALASHGLENEGWFDPWSFLYAFKRKAIHLGAKYVSGRLSGFGFEQRPKTSPGVNPEDLKKLHYAHIKLDNGEEHIIDFAILIIAAGALSGEIASMAGIGNGKGLLSLPIPIEPRKRYVYNIHCPEGPGLMLPFIIDHTGAYIRREGLAGHYLCGMSPGINEVEPSVDNLDVDYEFFENRVWPTIANRIPAFENSKLKSAWAGFYDFNSFDENAFIGQHPGIRNVFFASGFSGHGIQQAPAIGRALMELIVDGNYLTIDLSRLHLSRYIKDEPLWESNIV